MNHNANDGVFENISQRAVDSHRRAMAAFTYTPVEGGTMAGAPEMEASQRALHAFFVDLYADLFDHADRFGLPVGADASITEDEPDAKEKKQQVKRLLDKPRALLTRGLDYLQSVGRNGRLEGAGLLVEGYKALVKAAKVSPRFLDGLAQSGWLVSLSGDAAVIRHARFPGMAAALKALAEGCAQVEPERLGRFLFARCDFQALRPGYAVEATDLFRYFEGTALARVLQLHEFFVARGYHPEVEVQDAFAWSVKYQGNRKIKATPLFQVDFEERYQRPLRMYIKCASTARIADLLPHQPQFLQDDFIQRANVCHGDDCGWCKNHKTLGPSVVEYGEDYKTICWYTNPDVRVIDDETVTLIQQYARMHEELLPVG